MDYQLKDLSLVNMTQLIFVFSECMLLHQPCSRFDDVNVNISQLDSKF